MPANCFVDAGSLEEQPVILAIGATSPAPIYWIYKLKLLAQALWYYDIREKVNLEETRKSIDGIVLQTSSRRTRLLALETRYFELVLLEKTSASK